MCKKLTPKNLVVIRFLTMSLLVGLKIVLGIDQYESGESTQLAAGSHFSIHLSENRASMGSYRCTDPRMLGGRVGR